MVTAEHLIEEVVKCLEESVRRYDPSYSLDKSEMPDEVAELYRAMILQVSKVRNLSLPSKEEYFQALDNLAFDHPVLAFQIRGNEHLSMMFDAITEYEQQSLELLNNDPELKGNKKGAVVNSAQQMNERLKSELIADVDKDVIRLAQKCGKSERKQAIAITNSKPTFRADDTARREMNTFVDQMLEQAGFLKQQKPNVEPAHV
jgi:hypothetical protein